MHSLMLKTQFICQHYLIGKDFGLENIQHSHQYTLEIEIESAILDEYNYLIDIVDVKKMLDQVVLQYQDKTLNDLPEFKDQNPSLELFSKILWHKCFVQMRLPSPCQFIIHLWEDQIARASYKETIKINEPVTTCV